MSSLGRWTAECDSRMNHFLGKKSNLWVSYWMHKIHLKVFFFFHIVELHFHSLCSKWNTYYGNCNNLLLIIFHVSTVFFKMTIIMIMYCIYLISGIDAVTHSNSVHLLMCWLFDWGNICVCRDIEMFIKSLIQMATPAGDVTLVVACTICDLSCSFVSPHITYELWFL